MLHFFSPFPNQFSCHFTCKKRKNSGQLSIICTRICDTKKTSTHSSSCIHLLPAHVTEVVVRRVVKRTSRTRLGQFMPFAFGACTSVRRKACVRRRCCQQGSAKTFLLFPSLARTPVWTVREVILVLSFLPKVKSIVHQDAQRFDCDRVVQEFLILVKQSLTDRRNLE